VGGEPKVTSKRDPIKRAEGCAQQKGLGGGGEGGKKGFVGFLSIDERKGVRKQVGQKKHGLGKTQGNFSQGRAVIMNSTSPENLQTTTKKREKEDGCRGTRGRRTRALKCLPEAGDHKL